MSSWVRHGRFARWDGVLFRCVGGRVGRCRCGSFAVVVGGHEAAGLFDVVACQTFVLERGAEPVSFDFLVGLFQPRIDV